MDSKGVKTIAYVISMVLGIVLIGVPLTLIVWISLKAMGFDFMLRQVVGAEVLYTTISYWTWSLIAALRK